jgi:hypothetical protein
MRAAKLAAGPCGQQPGETRLRWYLRMHSMPEADQRLVHKIYECRYRRQEIDAALAIVHKDDVPTRWHHWRWQDDPVAVMLHPFNERYWTAFTAAREQWERKRADAAWEAELQRRVAIEARRRSAP